MQSFLQHFSWRLVREWSSSHAYWFWLSLVREVIFNYSSIAVCIAALLKLPIFFLLDRPSSSILSWWHNAGSQLLSAWFLGFVCSSRCSRLQRCDCSGRITHLCLLPTYTHLSYTACVFNPEVSTRSGKTLALKGPPYCTRMFHLNQFKLKLQASHLPKIQDSCLHNTP